jgi:hypothetical protein
LRDDATARVSANLTREQQNHYRSRTCRLRADPALHVHTDCTGAARLMQGRGKRFLFRRTVAGLYRQQQVLALARPNSQRLLRGHNFHRQSAGYHAPR